MFTPPALISAAHDVRNFDCGQVALNEFLIKYALANTSAGITRTYVTTPVGQATVVGYFSVAAGSVQREAVPERIAKGTPRHPIPIALLARLAVDRNYQGRKLGQGLLKHALLKILEAGRVIGIRAVLVQAKDERAAAFYARFGFMPSPASEFHLMLLLKDIARNIGG